MRTVQPTPPKVGGALEPENEPELRRLVHELPLPLLMKPRTQALSRMPGKTRIVHRREEIAPTWRAIRTANIDQPTITGIPNVDLPILQAYYTVSERVYTMDGFVDSTGTIIGAATCTRVLQLPRRSGPGVCFESAPLEPELIRGNGVRGRSKPVPAVAGGPGRRRHTRTPCCARSRRSRAPQWLRHPRSFLRKAAA